MRRTDKRKYHGRTQTMEEWANEYQLSWRTLYLRLHTGFTFHEALTTPFKKKRGKVEVNGVKVNLRQLALKAGLPYLCVWKRVVKLGWSLQDALTMPVTKSNRHIR